MDFFDERISWNWRSETVISRVNAKYPIWVLRQKLHRHVHESTWIRTCFTQPDMENVTPINNGEEYMLDFHAFGERDICPGATWVPFV